MIQGTAGASVVMNVVRAINVAAGHFVGINAILTLSAGTGGISVVVNVAIKNLVVVGPDRESPFGAVFDFESVNDVVTAVDIEADVTIGSVLSVNDSAAGNFGLEGNGTG